SIFFFQAEDGIRDGHVTGVQTCALPIFSVSEWSGAGTKSLALALVVSFLWFFDVCGRAALDFQLSKVPTLRSSAPADDRPGAACGQIRHATTPANSTARTATASQNF